MKMCLCPFCYIAFFAAIAGFLKKRRQRKAARRRAKPGTLAAGGGDYEEKVRKPRRLSLLHAANKKY